MNESIRDAVREIARDIIRDALENGDAIQAIRDLDSGIRAGWKLALSDIEAPEAVKAAFKM